MEGSGIAFTSALLATLGAVVYFSWSSKPAQAEQDVDTKTPSSIKSKQGGGGKRGKKRRPKELSSLIPTSPLDGQDDTSPSDSKFKPMPSASKRTSPPPSAPKVVIHRTSGATVPGGLAPLLSASEIESTHSASSSVANKSTQKKKRKGAKKEQSAVVQESESERMPPGGLMLAPPAPRPPVPSGSSPSPSNRKTAVLAPANLQETSGASEFDSESGWTRVRRSHRDRGGGGGAYGGTVESTSDAGITTSVTEEEGSVASANVSVNRDGDKTLTGVEKSQKVDR